MIILKYFDCHCDTLTKMYHNKKSFCNNGLDCDLDLIGQNDKAHIVYAIFNEGNYNRADITDIISYFYANLKDIKNAKAYLSIEGLGNQPDFKLSDIELYKNLGVRMMSLSWNYDNLLCGGIEKNLYGLTDLGKEAVREIDKNNVILDISHCSDKSSFQMIELSKNSVCASHSNSRTICKNQRNLTDEQFKMIIQSKGVVGINLYEPFLCEGRAGISDILRHIEYFVNIGGKYNLGLGTDFDGMQKKPSNINNCGDLYKIYDALLAKHYSKSFINALFFDNFSELFKKYEF